MGCRMGSQGGFSASCDRCIHQRLRISPVVHVATRQCQQGRSPSESPQRWQSALANLDITPRPVQSIVIGSLVFTTSLVWLSHASKHLIFTIITTGVLFSHLRRTAATSTQHHIIDAWHTRDIKSIERTGGDQIFSRSNGFLEFNDAITERAFLFMDTTFAPCLVHPHELTTLGKLLYSRVWR